MDEKRLTLLVEQAAKQNEQAFEELFKYYYSSVYKAAIKLCKNDADAQDIAQLTFLQVRKSIHTLEKPNYFPLWINRICVNKCKNLFRANKSDLYDEDYIKYFNMAIEERRDHNSEASLRFTSDHEVLMHMIATLSKEHQTILEMLYFKQLNQEEVASILGIPLGTVKSRSFAARNALKAKIEDYERREHTPLNFRVESLGTVFAMMLLHQQSRWAKELIFITQPSAFSRVQNWITGVMGNYLIGACVVVLGVSMIGIGNEIFNKETTQQSIQDDYVFQSVRVDDYLIDNEIEAYYLLKGYAYDETALHQLSSETIEDMRSVYNALKQSNRHMYQQLQKEGWTEAFEKECNR